MGIDRDKGTLHIFDGRITAMQRPSHLIPFESIAGEVEPTIWLGNLGLVPDLRYVLVDRSDHGNAWDILNQLTLNPKEWGWTLRGTPQQTKEFSETLFWLYTEAWNQQSQGKETQNGRRK